MTEIQPSILKLVLWPDDYQASTLIISMQDPVFIARIATMKDEQTIRMEPVIASSKSKASSPQEMTNAMAAKTLEWFNTLPERQDEAPITRCIVQSRGAWMIIPPMMFAYDPNTGTIKMVSVQLDKTAQINLINHDNHEHTKQTFALFNERHNELHANKNPIPDALNTGENKTGTQLPEILIRYETESDYKCFRDPATQPNSIYEWNQYINEISARLKAKSPPITTLDGYKYLLWLETTKAAHNSYKAQLDFIKSQNNA